MSRRKTSSGRGFSRPAPLHDSRIGRAESVSNMSELTYEPLIPGALAHSRRGVAALLLWYALRRPAAVSAGRWAMIVLLMAIGMAAVLRLC